MTDILRPKELIRLRNHSLRMPIESSKLPGATEAAYDFAAAVVGLLGKPIAAWKLGATTEGTRRKFSAHEIYFGALLSEEVWSAASGEPAPAPPQLRGEAEIAFRLSVDIEAEESAALLAEFSGLPFDCWTPAIESPYSCVENIDEAGLRALLIDRCAAGALYLGAPRSQMDDPEMMQTLEIFAATNRLSQGDAGSVLLMPPAKAALGFLKVAAAQGVNVRRGQWISTGGITPCVPMPFGQAIQLRLGGKTEFEILLQEPTQ